MVTITREHLCPDWSDDARGTAGQVETLERQLSETVWQIVTQPAEWTIPVSEMLDQWHLSVFHGLAPVDYYAGNQRGIHPDRPCLAVDVTVGGVPGTRHQLVAAEMLKFSDVVRHLVTEMDKLYLAAPRADDDIGFMIDAISWITGTFVRIHPYLNGNGRVSRLVSNALLYRYGFRIDTIRLNPRPDAPYGSVGAAAMRGEYIPLRDYILTAIRV